MPDAALGAAIGQADERAFPAHPDRQRGDLADIDAGGKAGAALGGTKRQVMLDPIALEHRNGAVVAMDRARDGDRPFRHQQAVALVHGDLKVIGDHAELVHRHLEHRTGIHGHRCLTSASPVRNSGQPPLGRFGAARARRGRDAWHGRSPPHGYLKRYSAAVANNLSE